jgi:hypothetical protein
MTLHGFSHLMAQKTRIASKEKKWYWFFNGLMKG